ncbi:protein SICKLE [Argentina anserina]|uniref:protein SICKLE n=1 Tax=Argentina anserina TaxID=57926 RepID=UPI0021768E52|nr:protein SICKLE [Potentilla anserina]XP_050379191.1 protein SICKLE [Potentilla anserina]
METSENRRERLKAMRLEAESSHNDTTADVPGFLSNPLADGNVVQEEPCSPSRFGFYTDPMAGFSTDTKRCKVGDQIASTSFKHSDASGLPMPRFPPPNLGRPRNPEMPPPSHQFQSHYTPDQRMYQQNFVPQRTPAGMVRPLAMHHGNPPDVWNGAEGQASYNFPSDLSSRFPSPGYRPPGSPGYEPPGSPGYRPPRNPGFGPLGNRGSGPPGSPGFRPLGSPAFRPPGSPGFRPPGSPGFRPPGSPGFRPPGSPGYGPPASAGYSSHSLQGRGHLVSHGQIPYGVHGGSHSPSSSSGRGRGRHGSGSDRGGRELHSHDRPFDPKRFYNASMVEDPWKGLAPVTWTASPPLIQKFLDTPSNGNKNKASISEYSNKSTPQPNLAEFLAASFKETIDEAPKS